MKSNSPSWLGVPPEVLQIMAARLFERMSGSVMASEAVVALLRMVGRNT